MSDQVLQETIQEAMPAEEQVLEESTQEAQEDQQEAPKPKSNEYNIRQLRAKAEERDYYYRRAQELEALRNQPAQAPQEDDVEPNPDDLVEWKQIKKRFNKLEAEINHYKQQSATSTAESRIKMQYPDFESVVNSDTIAMLREQYPELAATVNASNDLYTKASAAYTLIKKLNIAPDTQYASDRERATKNALKPRPLTSVSPQQGESPLSRANAFANGLTPELRSQLLKEMQEAKKKI